VGDDELVDESETALDEADEVDELDEVDGGVGDEANEDLGSSTVSRGISDDQVTYDVAPWAGESRMLLTSLLDGEDIPHVWQGTTLVVHADDEGAVDALIDAVADAAVGALDRNRARVVYEVGGWSAALQTSLSDSLTVADIPYEWDENGDLVVYEDDEARVEEIFEAMPDPEDPDAIDADGVDVTETLFRLWEAAGSLAKRPDDAGAVLAAIEHTGHLEAMAVPFGFEPVVWRDLCARAAGLRDALEADDAEHEWSDEELAEHAAELADLLRRYV